MVNYIKQELYGGAITVKIPTNLMDASNFRQIPDTQEVFLNANENISNYDELNKNDSIIFDLMEELETKGIEALKEHFNEISSLNDTENNWKLIKTEQIKSIKFNEKEASSFIGVGIEPALKWGRVETGEDGFKPTLVVILGLIRLNKVETDVLVTFNALIEDKKELEDLKLLHDDLESQSKENLALKRIDLAISVVKKALDTLNVEDWNLFG